MPRLIDLTKIGYRDIFCLMSIALDKTPFWTGWDSLVTENPLLTE